jgi:hypothetical protein
LTRLLMAAASIWVSPLAAVLVGSPSMKQRTTCPEARAIRVTDALSDKAPFVRVHDGTRLLGST